MDSILAFAMGEANRGKDLMVFDWNKAAMLIKKSGVDSASAGLNSDWEYTGGIIFSDGKPVPEDDTCVYLASTWATPKLEIDYKKQDCFIMESEVPEEWGDNYAKIYWPESALKIIKEE